MESLNTVLVTAYAKSPQGTSMYEVNKYAGLVLEIDKSTHKIVDAEFTFITGLAQRFFKKIFVGFDLTANLDSMIERIEQHYYAPSANAIIVALKSAQQRYLEKMEAN